MVRHRRSLPTPQRATRRPRLTRRVATKPHRDEHARALTPLRRPQIEAGSLGHPKGPRLSRLDKFCHFWHAVNIRPRSAAVQWNGGTMRSADSRWDGSRSSRPARINRNTKSNNVWAQEVLGQLADAVAANLLGQEAAAGSQDAATSSHQVPIGCRWSPDRRFRRGRQARGRSSRVATTKAPSGRSRRTAIARLGAHPSVPTRSTGKVGSRLSISPPPDRRSTTVPASGTLDATSSE